MKYFMCLFVTAALFAVTCAYPADDAAAAAASAAKAAASKGKSDATAATAAAAKAADTAKKADPKEAIAAMTKDAKGLNPMVFATEISKFMASISDACEKFIQSLFKGPSTGALPAGIPGMDEFSKISKLFNPLDASKDIFGNILKGFGGAASKEQKDASGAAAEGASAAGKDGSAAAAGVAGAAKAEEGKAAAALAAAKGKKDVVAAVEEAGVKAMSGLLGGFGL